MRYSTRPFLAGLSLALMLAVALAAVGMAGEPDTDEGANKEGRVSYSTQSSGSLATRTKEKEGKQGAHGGAQRRSGCGQRALVGEVTRVQGNTLTLATPRGERKVQLRNSTVVRSRGAARADSIPVGSRLVVKGEQGSRAVLVAERVRILPAAHIARRPFLGEFPAISAFLGLQPSELREQLRESKSLAEIAGTERTPRLINLIVSNTGKRIDQAVERGDLNEKRAAKIKAKLRERATRFVNRELNPSRAPAAP
ncbi:MAG: hypothetical protein M3Q29_24700 [Chloroflexota bacterium]|nr:hypothetical protein [Chloroflexota bacterium]